MKTSHLRAMKKLLTISLLFSALVLFALGALGEAQVVITVNGERIQSEARVVSRDGTLYVAVEDLFRDIGGIAYYSPIMNKANLKFGKISWVLSLDKGVAIADGREVPLEGKVFVENNKLYLSLPFLAELFGFRIPTRAQETPTPETPQLAPSPRAGAPVLSGVRFSSYNEEMRTRITFDFQGGVPPFTSQIDRERNTVTILFRNCSLGNVTSPVVVNDPRVGTITLEEKNGQVEANIAFRGTIQVREGKLDGGNPRAYFDLISLVEVTEEVPPSPGAPPSPRPSPPPRPSPTPALSPTPSPSFEVINRNVVVLDPGHGGNDPGCVHNGYQEKTIVLEIAKRVRDILRTRGYEVYMTREDDTYPTLDDRYHLANSKNPFAFVSIHCNASPNPKASGVEVFVGGTKPRGEGALDVAQRENAPFLAEQKAPSGSLEKLNSIYTSAYYLKSREASAKLGDLVVQRVANQTGLAARGVKEAPLVVLGHMFYPACLVEVGFLSNPSEAKKLASPSFQDRIARGIADAIEAFAKSPELAKLLGG